jgi:hypothetical protein
MVGEMGLRTFMQYKNRPTKGSSKMANRSLKTAIMVKIIDSSSLSTIFINKLFAPKIKGILAN